MRGAAEGMGRRRFGGTATGRMEDRVEGWKGEECWDREEVRCSSLGCGRLEKCREDGRCSSVNGEDKRGNAGERERERRRRVHD